MKRQVRIMHLLWLPAIAGVLGCLQATEPAEAGQANRLAAFSVDDDKSLELTLNITGMS
ncbi:MAG: hypothetical protein N2C12_18125 [Planctomycetales bacterium]